MYWVCQKSYQFVDEVSWIFCAFERNFCFATEFPFTNDLFTQFLSIHFGFRTMSDQERIEFHHGKSFQINFRDVRLNSVIFRIVFNGSRFHPQEVISVVHFAFVVGFFVKLHN